MLIKPERAEAVVLAACTLHNMLMSDHPGVNTQLVDSEDPISHDVNEGDWRRGPVMENLQPLKGNNSTNAGKAYREYLTQYFQTEAGSVPWQERQSRFVH